MSKLCLNDLEGCFEGTIPSKIATCSKNGIPNASYLSHVYHVDEKHIAVSYQFFNKTRLNLLENPFASIQVRHPGNLQAYRLSVKYLRSEDSGPVFDKMAIKLDVLAASEGMGEVFKLKAADIYEVLEIEEMQKRASAKIASANASLEDLEIVKVISDKLNAAKNMEELFDLSLELLHQYLGWTHLILLLFDETQKSLLTHATFGYSQGGVGSEVPYGKGLIGLCAQNHRALQISGLSEGVRYAQAAKKSLEEASSTGCISLPGIKNPAAQAASPILLAGDLQGVLFIESESQSYWTKRDLLFLSMVSNLIGLGLRSFEQKPDVIRPFNGEIKGPVASTKMWCFRYVAQDEIIFINNIYLIKNIPARILHYLIRTFLVEGRTEFSNMELRAEKSLQLPEYKDNLEARLILLRKRLEEQQAGILLVSTGRGKFKLLINGELKLN